jgi:hypothetical protein
MLEIGTGGHITLGQVGFTDTTSIALTDLTSVLDVGTLYMSGNSSITAAPLATVNVTDSFLYAVKNASQMVLDQARVQITGGGLHYLEVGGLDNGLGGSTLGNFGMGQLIVGTEEQASTVMLVDLLDNGNRIGGLPEALYLYGLGGADGLSLTDNSQVVFDGINVYAWMQADWVHLNDLFAPGITQVPYVGGTLMMLNPAPVPEPSTIVLLAGGALSAALFRLTRRRGKFPRR